MTTSVMWFRRDLRLADNPALLEAIKSSDEVVALFVLDGHLRKPAGAPRLVFLYDNLRRLDDSIGGRLVVRTGDPVKVVRRVAKEVEATGVFCAEDFGPYGRERDDHVQEVLERDEIEFHRIESNYAVAPGEINKGDGTPFKVFTPFSRAWKDHGWGRPHRAPRSPKWAHLDSDGVPKSPKVDAELPPAGEDAAAKRLRKFLRDADSYAQLRDQPASGGTSRLSPYLKYGIIHPRQVLDKLGNSEGERTFRDEICWRDFYADVLFHNPKSVNSALNDKMTHMKLDSGAKANKRFEAWKKGMTGYPIVDAGMRQLLGEAWMHNRVRMIVASFLVKDLHIDWHEGALHFLDKLVDGDIASNNHGWQWIAGTGTDAAPYFRVFNPVTQGQKFDKGGAYIRKWVPELRDLEDKYVHEPWNDPDGLPSKYPERIVDHADERKEALRRYSAL